MPVTLDEIREPFVRWLGQRWPQRANLTIRESQEPKSGFSAQTIILPVSYEQDGDTRDEKVVLRLENPEPAIYPVQGDVECEVEIQYRTMAALAREGVVPLAPLIGYEGDASVLGTPFYVMGFVGGEVPVEDPIYTKEGFFVDAKPEERARLVEEGIRAMAAVHRVDWRAAGFEWLVPEGAEPTLARQLQLWEDYARRELGDRVHPGIERVLPWLHDNLPETHPPALSWGDSRPGNIIWRDFRPLALTDFENVAVAPPEFDLGWWLMFDRWSHETYGQDRLPGEPTRAEQAAMYERFSGLDIGDTLYYEMLGAFRYAAIVVRVMNRLVERGTLPEDQELWRQNPASTCLDHVLEEAGVS